MSFRSRVHQPFLVVGRRTALRPDFLQVAFAAARSSGALLLLPSTILADLGGDDARAAREALATCLAQLAVARPPREILEEERETGVATQSYADDEAWRRLRAVVEGRTPAPRHPEPTPIPTLGEELLAKLTAGSDAPLPERLAAARTTELLRGALRDAGWESASAARLAAAPSFCAHLLLSQIAAALLPPSAPMDRLDHATIAAAAISLDLVTDDEDARALFQDVTQAVDLRWQHDAA